MTLMAECSKRRGRRISGACMGRGRRREGRWVTDSGGATAAARPMYPQVRRHFSRSRQGAPSRIRTCAHGSGGRVAIGC